MKQVMKIGLIALLTFGVAGASCNADRDEIVAFTSIPQTAQSFVKTHFPSVEVSIVTKDKELLNHSYELVLTNGVKIEFNRKGEWTDIDGRGVALPSSVIPAAIRSYVSQNFRGQEIVQIEKTDRGRYAVELSTGVDLLFGSNYKFIGLDD